MKNKLKFPDKKFLNRTEPQKECEHIIDENEAVKGNYQCELCGCQVFQPQEEAKSIEEKAKYVTRKIFLRLLNNHNIISTDMQIHIKEVLIEEYASQFQTEQRQVITERTYLSGCTWCDGIGFVTNKYYVDYTTPLTHICPVCNGNKTIIVTEIIKQPQQLKQ